MSVSVGIAEPFYSFFGCIGYLKEKCDEIFAIRDIMKT